VIAHLVPPPYGTIFLGPLGDHSPLGTVALLLCPTASRTDLVVEVAALPLMVPIVWIIPANGPEPLPPVDFRERQLALVPAGNSLSPADIVAAVNARPRLSPERMGAWLAARLGNPLLADIVREALTTSSHPSPRGLSLRNLQRIVPKVLHCRVSDLVRLHRLATLPRCCSTVDALAKQACLATTHLRDQVRGLGISLRDYNQWPGWEWVLEAAVRKGLGAGGWAKIAK